MSAFSKKLLVSLGVCTSVYLAWQYQQGTEKTNHSATDQPLIKTTEDNIVSQKNLSSNQSASLLQKIHEQLLAQQRQIEQQQQAINKLYVALNERQMDSALPLADQDIENSSIESPEEQTVQQIEPMETALSNEAIDEKWSQAAADNVADAIHQVMPEGVEISQLDCQSTFCKLALEHLTETELEDLMDNFLFKLGWKTTSFTQTTDHEDGSKATVVYLSRDGYRLPDV